MGLFTKKPPNVGPATSITAAAVSLVADSGDDALAAFSKRREEWQTRAWEYYDEIGEVRQVARSMGDVFARVPWYVGVRPDPLGDVLPLYSDDSDAYREQQTQLPAGFRYSTDEAQTAIEALEALRSPIGGQSEIKRQIGVSLFVPGECFLVGIPNEQADQAEDAPQHLWDIRSTDELVIDTGNKRTNSAGQTVPTFKLKPPGAGTMQAKELPVDTFVVRIWRPHPRHQDWADSPMRSAMTICHELLHLTRAIEGAASSRIVGPGVMWMPNRMRNPRGQQSDGQAARTDSVIADILEAASLAIANPSSAAAQVPLTIWLDDDLWEKVISGNPLTQWDRTIDEIAAQQRAELITRFANAIDWPAELLTGKVGINHWGAWLLKDEAFQSNAEPYEVIAVDAVTRFYLHPNLEAVGMNDPHRFVVWYDPTGVVSDPDESDKALQADDRLLISSARTRRALGFTEDDAPSEEELQQRILIQRFLKTGATGGQMDGQGTPAQSPVEVPSAVRTETLALDEGLAFLPKVLADIDQALLIQTHQRADAAMRRALERANARLVTLAQKDRTLRPTLDRLSVADLSVAPTLGPAVVARLTAADDNGDGEDLLAGAFLAFGAWYDARVERADQAIVGLLEDQGADPAAVKPELDTAREASTALVVAALIALGSTLLLRPEPVPGPGETDGTSLVPPGVLRDALARAGGGGTKAAGLTTGDLIRDLFGRQGVTFGGYVWVYGDPSQRVRPYRPHQALDGQPFGDVDDDRLGAQVDESGYAWPGVTHYWPGDHPGCLCRVDLAQPRRTATPGLASFATTGG